MTVNYIYRIKNINVNLSLHSQIVFITFFNYASLADKYQRDKANVIGGYIGSFMIPVGFRGG